VKKLSTAVILVLMVMALAVAGCKKQTAGSAAAAPAPAQVKTIADFPDHGFNADAYIQGMVKGAPNLLVWQDPAANLGCTPSSALPKQPRSRRPTLV